MSERNYLPYNLTMEQELDDELTNLKHQLHEFFTHAISNNRRKEIESNLNSWQSNPFVFRKCINFLTRGEEDQYLLIFCLNTLEGVMKNKWVDLSDEYRLCIRSFLFNYSIDIRANPVISSKTVKIFVDTAQIAIPFQCENFYISILDMLWGNDTIQLGLVYILTISQEWGSSQSMTVKHNQDLRSSLILNMSKIFPILSDLFLEKTADEGTLLTIFSQVFTFMPAECIPKPEPLLDALFQIAVCSQSCDQALLALSAINEMICRYWSPSFSNKFYQFILFFLQTPCPNFDKRYLEKMCDILRIFTISYMSKNSEKVNELLTLILQWTERQETIHPGLTSSVRVWVGVLDHPYASKYGDEWVKLASLVLHRIQWTKNNQLIEDNHESVEEFEELEADETPWQRALRPCLELVARVAEIRPEETLNIVISQWVELCQKISTMSPLDSKMEPLLRDVASFTRAVGRLSPFWREEDACHFIRSVTSQLLSLIRIQNHSMTDNGRIELIVTHCECLAALKACSMWLPRLPEDELRNCIYEILPIIAGFLTESSPRKMQHSAAHLFSTLTATVRLLDSWEHPSIRPMYDHPLSYLQQEDGYLVTGGLLNCLILPIVKLESLEPRLELASKFVERFTQTLSPTSDVVAQTQTLHLITHLISMYHGEGSKQKKIICAVFQNAAEKAIGLYRFSNENATITREVLRLFQTLLECLQTQVGVGFVQGVVQTLVTSFSGEKLQKALEGEDGGGLQQLLSILDLVVSTPAMLAAGLTPLTVSLTLQLSEPMLRSTASPELQEPYFKLVYSILDNKWKYFERGCVDSDQRVEEFLGLLRIMGGSLLLTDINIFSLNLNHFEKLNQHWRLYRTTFFKNELLENLIIVLLRTLLNKTHSLLADEITSCLCHLISTDPEAFFNGFLVSFISSINGICEGEKEKVLINFGKDLDVPSLTKNILRLTHDLSFYSTH